MRAADGAAALTTAVPPGVMSRLEGGVMTREGSDATSRGGGAAAATLWVHGEEHGKHTCNIMQYQQPSACHAAHPAVILCMP